MTASIPATASTDMLRLLTRASDQVLRVNVDGITHEESLIQPQPGGNCLNFIVGHLVCVYNNALPLLGQQPVLPADRIGRYDRGSQPMTDSGEAMDFGELLKAWREATKRFDAGLADLSQEDLDRKAPFSPGNNPDETVGSLLGFVSFHQAYHVGQTALSRRLIGKPGAIK